MEDVVTWEACPTTHCADPKGLNGMDIANETGWNMRRRAYLK